MSTAVKKTEKPTSAASISGRIYIGPGFKGLAKGSIFIGELPEHIKDEIKKIPALGALFVDVSSLVEANKEMQDSTSRLSSLYAYVEKKKEER